MFKEKIGLYPVIANALIKQQEKSKNCLHLLKCSLVLFIVAAFFCVSQGKVHSETIRSKNVTISKGWAQNSINSIVFRRNAVTSHGKLQYAAFYDEDGVVTLARRELGSVEWEIKKTQYRGDTTDAHNSISIMIDGEGILHVAWGHYGTPLQYCRSVKTNSLELTGRLSMTGQKEQKITYPEFYKLPSGDLLFFYRDGSSGRGNVVLNLYNTDKKEWLQVQDAFIDGEGERNAYWQVSIDKFGTVHISWVWRESADVASNHDLCYAKSMDNGKTWLKSTGEKYQLPITIDNAEYAYRIPQGSGLINQTSMSADSSGRPYVATYWRPIDTAVPQYHLVYNDGNRWNVTQVSQRTKPFILKGGGTKKIPLSRPQIVIRSVAEVDQVIMIFRDVEHGNRVSAAMCDDIRMPEWRTENLTDYSVGKWEPSYDSELWARTQELHLFVQEVGQGDGETLEDVQPQLVSILEWSVE